MDRVRLHTETMPTKSQTRMKAHKYHSVERAQQMFDTMMEGGLLIPMRKDGAITGFKIADMRREKGEDDG